MGRAPARSGVARLSEACFRFHPANSRTVGFRPFLYCFTGRATPDRAGARPYRVQWRDHVPAAFPPRNAQERPPIIEGNRFVTCPITTRR